MKIVYEETDVFTQDLKIGDSFRVGDLMVNIIAIRTNYHDNVVLDLNIIGAPLKKSSKMMLVIPKNLPVQTLK